MTDTKQDKKDCPYCGEEILAKAKKCKHCGEFLEPSLRQLYLQQRQQPAPKQVIKSGGEGCFLQTLNVGCFIILLFIAFIIYALVSGSSI